MNHKEITRSSRSPEDRTIHNLKLVIVSLLTLFVILPVKAQLPTPTAFPNANTVFVDPTYGDDIKGTREHPDLPFKTLGAALTTPLRGAQSGDKIEMRPGTYPQVSTSITTSLNNLTIIGHGAMLQTSSISIPGGGWILKFTGTGNRVLGLTLDGNRGSNTTPTGWGLIEVAAPGNALEHCVFQNAIGYGVHVTAAGLERLSVEDNEFNNVLTGVSADNTTGTGSTFYFKIERNRIHDSWATSGTPMGINVQSISGGAIVSGVIALNQIWNWPNISGAIGIQVQGSTQRVSTYANEIRCQWGISYDGGQYNDAKDNHITEVASVGIEFSSSADFHGIGNTIQGAGTGSGYLVADTGGAQGTLEGGSISNCGNAIHAALSTGLQIKNITFYNTPAGTSCIYLQANPGPIAIKNCDFYINGAGTGVDILQEGANGTHIDVLNNRFYGKATNAPISYWKNSTGTLSDCDVSGNVIDTANNLTGNGFVKVFGGASNIRQRFNSPINTATDFSATDSVGTIKQIGSVQLVGATADHINDDLAIYNRVSDALNKAISTGVGSPEWVVTAGPGSLYLRRDGGAGTCLYIKESGTGNTGWVSK